MANKKVEKFEKLVADGKDYIKNEEKLSPQEKELLIMSLNTMLETIVNYKKD